MSSLDQIKTTPPNTHDLTLPKEEALSYEKESIKDIISNRAMREKYAEKAYTFAKYTIIGWAVVVFFYILQEQVEPKKISDTALGIITTGCTVNILVAFHAVIKGLFSSKE